MLDPEQTGNNSDDHSANNRGNNSGNHRYTTMPPLFTTKQGETSTLAAYEATLRKWSAPYRELYIPTSLGTTHVVASGAAVKPPLVLLHAMFATATVWYPNAAGLSEHFRVYAVDIIGEANKSRPARRITSLEDYAQWFRELLDALGVREANLAGNSFGGFLSAYLAMSLPKRVRRLVLISPAATFHQIVPFYMHMFIPKALYLLFPGLPGQRRVMQSSIRWAYAGLPHDRAWTRLFYLLLMHGSTATQVFPRLYTAEELAQIEAPTLLLVGDREKVYGPEAVISAAKELMPTISTAVIQDAHHLAAMAQPQAVNEEIVAFCSSGARCRGLGVEGSTPARTEAIPELSKVRTALPASR